MTNSIKNCRMNWNTEEHSYTFKTDGDLMCSLDFLSDLSQSLRLLTIYLEGKYRFGDELPEEIKVVSGGSSIFVDENIVIK
jgi:hypothetical protein